MPDPGGTPEPQHHGWATLPNAITLARLLLFVPLIVLLVLGTDERVWTAVALAVFGGTDWVDGFLARRTQTVSDVGIWLDPLADRVGIMAVVLAMTLATLVPWWAVAVIVVVDVVVFLSGLTHRDRMRLMQASWAGKTRTALLMVALPALLLGDSAVPGASVLHAVGLVCLVLGALLHVLTGTGYVLRLTGRRGSELSSGTPAF